MYESGRLAAPVNLPLANKGDVIGEFFGHPGSADATVVDRGAPVVNRPIARDPPARDGRWPARAPELAVVRTAFRIGRSRRARPRDAVEAAQLHGRDARSPRSSANSRRCTARRRRWRRRPAPSAIHVAVAAINPDPCDEIITTAMSDMGTVIPILLANCIPVFADVDPLTGNLTAETIAKKITPRTRAVIVVHLVRPSRGHGADRRAAAVRRGSRSSRTAPRRISPSTGARRSVPSATWAASACSSRSRSPAATAASRSSIARICRARRAFSSTRAAAARPAGVHLFLGANYRMTELQGTVARAQLAKCAAI